MDDYQKRAIIKLCAAQLAWFSNCGLYFYAIQKGACIYHTPEGAMQNPDNIGRRLQLVPDEVVNNASKCVVDNDYNIYDGLVWC